MVSLPVTNGGIFTNIWKAATSKIDCGTTLRANSFPTSEIQPDDIPFWIVGSMSPNYEVGDLMGFVVVTSVFYLSNPTHAQSVPSAPVMPGRVIHTSTPTSKSDIRVPVSYPLSFTLDEGEDYYMYPFAPMPLVVGTETKVLQGFIGTYTGDETIDNVDYHMFSVSNNFDSFSTAIFLLGTAANFLNSRQ